jgi:5-methylcytosine-specific restriction endonuclease McrA
MLCEYGCGQEGEYQFKNGKICCSSHYLKCPSSKNKISGVNNPFYGKKHKSETIKKNILFNKLRKHGSESKEKIRSKMIDLWNKDDFRIKVLKNLKRRTISMIKNKYPIFYSEEEMRYDPTKSKEKEIQVHCKNHLCRNSKEMGGWFTPSGRQIESRIWALENENGNGGCYFYCSELCKNKCPLYGLQSDPYKENQNTFTKEEYQQFREFVLERDDYICQYCEELATIVHHERPQKLEPLFVLDPDFAWSCCEECHYKYGHKTGTECSTGKLAAKICI